MLEEEERTFALPVNQNKRNSGTANEYCLREREREREKGKERTPVEALTRRTFGRLVRYRLLLSCSRLFSVALGRSQVMAQRERPRSRSKTRNKIAERRGKQHNKEASEMKETTMPRIHHRPTSSLIWPRVGQVRKVSKLKPTSTRRRQGCPNRTRYKANKLSLCYCSSLSLHKCKTNLTMAKFDCSN